MRTTEHAHTSSSIELMVAEPHLSLLPPAHLKSGQLTVPPAPAAVPTA